jgi:hypothetical protein
MLFFYLKKSILIQTKLFVEKRLKCRELLLGTKNFRALSILSRFLYGKNYPPSLKRKKSLFWPVPQALGKLKRPS